MLTEFCPILHGAQIRIHTDHKNLLARDVKSQRLLRWHMLIDEYNPEIIYKPGPENIVADSLSRLSLTPDTVHAFLSCKRRQLSVEPPQHTI